MRAYGARRRRDDERGTLDVDVQQQIDRYISDQPAKKRDELHVLHGVMLKAASECKLSFFDGRNNEGKVVSNPTIGYGSRVRRRAKVRPEDSFLVGLSANTTGMSIYLMGLSDKKYLSETYAERLGKATVTGYCVKFRNLRDVNVDVIEEMVANHMRERSAGGS
ncbi:MAG TPA: hypothetical protein VGF50_14660 [Caulobacteraceae bacterium]